MKNITDKISRIIKQLYPLNRCLVSEGFDKALDIINEHYPLYIYKYPTNELCFTWDLPKKWEVKEAYIKDPYTGKDIVNIKLNGLSVCVNSCSVQEQKISIQELEKHLFYDIKNPDQVPYRYFYYKYDKWGFCLSYNEYLNLVKSTEYIVKIASNFTDGLLKIGEFKIKGQIEEEIIIISHLDHPFQANDNLSGVATLLFLIEKFIKEGSRYTLRFIFNPETIGSIVYMSYRKNNTAKIKYAVCIDAVGTQDRLLIQNAFRENCLLNRIAQYTAEKYFTDNTKYKIDKYRANCGSDEMAFSDPNWGIDALAILRWPYKYYHSHLDSLELIDYTAINATAEYVGKIIETVNKDYVINRNFLCPLMRDKVGWYMKDMTLNLKIDKFNYYVNGTRSIFELSELVELDFEFCSKYADDLISQKLFSIVS